MSHQQAHYIFKLRRNITLEGDLSLAKAELEAFLPDPIRAVNDISIVTQEFPILAKVVIGQGLTDFSRVSGTQAYLGTGRLAELSDLIRCLSFIQEIYCLTADTTYSRETASLIENRLGKVITFEARNAYLIIKALPHNMLVEVTEGIARHSKNAAQTKQNLHLLLQELLGVTKDPPSVRFARTALSAAFTTSHLSHDLHYYKAKFFPRMVRSLINISVKRVNRQEHRFLDNFAGSGTAILEASLLGIPSVGIDIDPLSALIANTKMQVIHLDSEFVANEAELARQQLERQEHSQLGLFHSSRNWTGDGHIKFPFWLMKNRKMTSETAAELCQEIQAVQSVLTNCDPQIRNLFSVLLSDAISRKIKMRFMGTGVGRFSLTFAKTSIARLFINSLTRYVKVVAVCEWLRNECHFKFADSTVVNADTRQIPDSLGKFDILVSSPPYLPASSGRESYAKARAVSLIALGMKSQDDVDNLVDDSIGSMQANDLTFDFLTDRERHIVEWLEHDELRAIKAAPTARYFYDMRQTFSEMYRVLVPGALAVMVSGKESTFYQFSTREPLYVVPAAELLAEQAQSTGFEVEKLHDIQLSKSNRNARPRSLDDYYETLIFLKKPEA